MYNNASAYIETPLFSGVPYNTPSEALLTMAEDHPRPLAPSHRCLYILYRFKASPVQRRGGSYNNTDSDVYSDRKDQPSRTI